MTLPVAGYTMPAAGEFGYQAAMTMAFREHLQWGSQVVWSYGPYGFLNEPAFMDFNTWLLAFAANFAAHIALFAVLALFLFRIGARPWLFMLVAAVTVLSIDRYQGHEFERFMVLDQKAALVATLLLYLAAETSRRKEAAIFAGGAGLIAGYLFLDKGTYMLAGAALVAVYLVLSVAGRRAGSAIALLGGALVGFLVLWLLAGQAIAGIPSYFRTSFEIIAGYTPAMSWIDESGALNPMLQWGIAVAMLAVWGLALLITLRRRQWPLFRLQLLMTPILLFLYKNSFIRFDEGHALAFWALVAVLEGLVLARAVAAEGEIKRSAPVVLVAATMVVCLVLVGGLGPYIGGFPDKARSVVLMQPSLAFPANLASYRHAASLISRPSRRSEEEGAVRDSMRTFYALPPDVVDQLRNGTVDVVPFDLQIAYAYDFKWDPQPVLLSYSAYRPYLDHLDALHYTGPAAPRYVLFTAFSTDGRYPLFDEPATYRVLFENYQVMQLTSNFLVLERRSDPASLPQTHAGSATGRIGEWIAVPQHGDQRLYGRLQVDYSLLGQAMNLLDRPPELHIRFQYGGGKVSPAYRFIPADGADGLDLSGYAPDTASVNGLAQGQFDQPIEAIEVLADTPVEAYQQQVKIAYFTQPVT